MGLKDFLNRLALGTTDKVEYLEGSEDLMSEKGDEFFIIKEQIFHELLNRQDPHWKKTSFPQSAAYAKLKKKDDGYKTLFIYYLINRIELENKTPNTAGTKSIEDRSLWRTFKITLLESLLKTKIDFEEDDMMRILTHFCLSIRETKPDLCRWPLALLVMQLAKLAKRRGLSLTFQKYLKQLVKGPEFEYKRVIWGAEMPKLKKKIMSLLPYEQLEEEPVALDYFLKEKDRFGLYVNTEINALPEVESKPWHKLLTLAASISGGKPSEKYIDESRTILEIIGMGKSREFINKAIALVIELKVEEHSEVLMAGSREYIYTKKVLISTENALVLKGLVWAMVHFDDSHTLANIANLAERCFKKIPGVGPSAAGVGNAAIYVLAHSGGLEGIGHLSRLKLKIPQNNTRKLIQKYLEEASAKRGVSTEEIEEMSVPDFDLTLGQKKVGFDDYQLGISVIGVGKTQMVWYKPDGQVQKTPPAFIKQSKKLSDLLKKVKAEVKQIQKYSTAQRDRIDRSFIQDRSMDYAHFVRYYHEHGLVSAISRKLLWNFTNGEQEVTGLWQDGLWQDLNGREVSVLPEATRVRLWHPIQTDTDTVLAWRDKLDGLSWQQPIKQVYREIYVLTDAEINTVSYSNRMAAHILKQHQFKALTGIRGWSYQLMGCYDDGVDGVTCRLPLPGWNMSAEYWINEIYMEDAFNDAGIWDYVATDQLKFTDNNGQAIPLIDVPKIVFSEAMRDADLFVGVASVGNDPAWVDSGGERVRGYTDYWQSYSFGDLNEMAKTRKQVLERLVPRLKIKEVARIDGKFLRIKGKVREYKIHIGSTNILMEPNDQYLCIVPARGKSFDTSNLFIPFEGDRGLSLVLSKAFLLAADDKITDSTILSQIRR